MFVLSSEQTSVDRLCFGLINTPTHHEIVGFCTMETHRTMSAAIDGKHVRSTSSLTIGLASVSCAAKHAFICLLSMQRAHLVVRSLHGQTCKELNKTLGLYPFFVIVYGAPVRGRGSATMQPRTSQKRATASRRSSSAAKGAPRRAPSCSGRRGSSDAPRPAQDMTVRHHETNCQSQMASEIRHQQRMRHAAQKHEFNCAVVGPCSGRGCNSQIAGRCCI